jgi:hypothetical protein
LEARWAVVFHELGLLYHYEPQGYDLGPDLGAYLPDFWLPKQSGFRGAFMEIKPTAPSYPELRRCEALAEGLGENVYLFYETLNVPDWLGPQDNPGVLFLGRGGCDAEHYWCECGECGAVGIEYHGDASRLPCGCLVKLSRTIETDTPRLRDAFATALGERFDNRAS